MTALATTIGGIYALGDVVRDDTSTAATDPNSVATSQDPSLVEPSCTRSSTTPAPGPISTW